MDIYKFVVVKNIALVVMGVCDLALGGVVMATWHQVCDAPLRWWYLGSLALGFPVSQIVYSGTNSSFRKSFIFEMAALIIAFAWLVMGTIFTFQFSFYFKHFT